MRYLLDKMHTELAEGSIFASTICRDSKKSTIVSEIFGGVLQSDVSSTLIIFALPSAWKQWWFWYWSEQELLKAFILLLKVLTRSSERILVV